MVIFRKVHPAEDPVGSDKLPTTEDPCYETSSEVTNMSLYSPQVILQVDNPSGHVQFYPELVRTVTVPQNVVLTSFNTLMNI